MSAPAPRVRVAGPADVPALLRVRTRVRQNHLSREQLAARGITPRTVAASLEAGSRAWVAEAEGRVMGFCIADGGDGSVFALFVLPEAEGRGAGRALLREAEAWLFARGWPRIRLLTDPAPRLRANGFYPHMGWRPDGLQPHGQLRYVREAPAS